MRGPASRRSQWVTNACVLVAAFGALLLAAGHSSSRLTLTGTGDGPVNPGHGGGGVTDGGIASTGRFTLAGVIHDHGRYTDYRTVHGHLATVRKVLAGAKGTITIVITIHLGSAVVPRWQVTSGTGRYAGLRAAGTLTADDYKDDPYTFVMAGSVSR